jgi:hypothetical protein
MVNFIKHILVVTAMQADDTRLTPHHISLYLALFRCWNLNRFRNPLTIHRATLMYAAKIGSKNTYSKCLQELHKWGYIVHSPRQGGAACSIIYLLRFDLGELKRETDSSTTSDTTVAKDVSRSSIKSDQLAFKSDTTVDQNEDYCSPTSGTLLLNNINSLNPSNRERHSGNGDEKMIEKKKTIRHTAIPVSVDEVKKIFTGAGATALEAEKFYYHYQANGWRVGRVPMQNWHAAAHKWILNTNATNQQYAAQQKNVNKKNYAEPL